MTKLGTDVVLLGPGRASKKLGLERVGAPPRVRIGARRCVGAVPPVLVLPPCECEVPLGCFGFFFLSFSALRSVPWSRWRWRFFPLGSSPPDPSTTGASSVLASPSTAV